MWAWVHVHTGVCLCTYAYVYLAAEARFYGHDQDHVAAILIDQTEHGVAGRRWFERNADFHARMFDGLAQIDRFVDILTRFDMKGESASVRASVPCCAVLCVRGARAQTYRRPLSSSARHSLSDWTP